jgi:hypothetical protein
MAQTLKIADHDRKAAAIADLSILISDFCFLTAIPLPVRRRRPIFR